MTSKRARSPHLFPWLLWAATLAGIWAEGRAAPYPPPAAGSGAPLNILLITTDDMGCEFVGAFGATVPNITPNLDALASQGIRFTQAHVTSAICQPSRSALMTGRYPHRSGALGFTPIREEVPTLPESLRKAGYLNGIFSKTEHLEPKEKFCWDVEIPAQDLRDGRDPALYYRQAKEFFKKAKEAGRPFFLMANTSDPHRPFAGSAGKRREKEGANPPIHFAPGQIPVPRFLPDLPDVQKDLAQYGSSISRADKSVGEILRALSESGLSENTLVTHLGDNGMPFPFAKTNCYRASTRTPWIVRWPGVVKPGAVEDEQMISGIDFMPTVLEAAGIPAPGGPDGGMDGRSFLPLLKDLKDHKQSGRDFVVTFINSTALKRDYPMRALQTKHCGYIFNPWSSGQTLFRNESQHGLTYQAMTEAASNDKAIAARVDFFLKRVPEEFYDYETDPDSLKNLIDDPAWKPKIEDLRARLLDVLESTGDPVAAKLKKRMAETR